MRLMISRNSDARTYQPRIDKFLLLALKIIMGTSRVFITNKWLASILTLAALFTLGWRRYYGVTTPIVSTTDNIINSVSAVLPDTLKEGSTVENCHPISDQFNSFYDYLLSFDNPGEVNSLRRTMGIEKPACYERHLPFFANYTKHRLDNVKNHLVLHIPKCGGTSLCTLAKRYNKSVPDKFTVPKGGNNCVEMEHLYPLWCCGDDWPERKGWFDDGDNVVMNTTTTTSSLMMCDAFEKGLLPFTMNENYLDHPLCMNNRIYTILIREPIERTLSHEKHLGAFYVNGMDPNDYSIRLNLVRNNYMTWALAIGSTNSTTNARKVTMPLPHSRQRELLEVAKSTLLKLDFLFEPSSFQNNEECNHAILTLLMDTMPFQGQRHGGNWNVLSEFPRTNGGDQWPKLVNNVPREQYEEWNALDIELYQYAKRLMELDCKFFLM